MEKTSPGGRRLAERQTDEGSVEELKNGGVLDEAGRGRTQGPAPSRSTQPHRTRQPAAVPDRSNHTNLVRHLITT